MNETELLKSISNKLSILISLGLGQDKGTMKDKVRQLVKYGLSNQEMADILGTTKGTIEVVKSSLNRLTK